ncbi:lytic murein transglycosylase B [Chiayiivirga flava]|uniref:Membrane-bound lytic murein transglycosylase B n=1 Tax=Chiayiivirga flava TaxID=659595 RepID=A0A7W8DA72_9GAMM|nr:lytic murein transglycosylase B [Chiayiivirga flava]MBB5209610.1 membrane-bound lytic murein transglycosylase B [Chiayiivirga flava]
MPPICRFAPFLLPLAFAVTAHAQPRSLTDAQRDAFVGSVQDKYQVAPETVLALLAKAKYQQSIIDAITRPAEAKPWSAYRPIFMNTARIDGGRAFLAQHRDALKKVEAETGVPAELIVAIIGVETSYGKITGKYKVLDALYTLGFFYPKREAFFRGELEQVFKLAEEESLDLAALQGSYAGAMGWGQFMPSSYRAYAVDGDGDGKRDLFGSLPDIFASIANYFVAHGWEPGEPVALPAMRSGAGAEFVPDGMEAKYSLPDLAEKGYRPREAVGHAANATVLNLDGADGREHWITFKNFYVISRYNRSPLYSLAVYQLSQAIADREDTAVTP